jgi:hypothetical protein
MSEVRISSTVWSLKRNLITKIRNQNNRDHIVWKQMKWSFVLSQSDKGASNHRLRVVNKAYPKLRSAHPTLKCAAKNAEITGMMQSFLYLS